MHVCMSFSNHAHIFPQAQDCQQLIQQDYKDTPDVLMCFYAFLWMCALMLV